MAEINDTDLFLVNRNETSATVPASDLMAELLDDDYMIVNRGDVTYKVLGADVLDSLSDIINPTIDNILIDGQPPTEAGTVDDPIILTPITVAKSGQLGETVEEITVQGQKEGKYVIFIDNSVGAGDRFVQLVHQIDAAGQWTGHLEYADTPPTTDETVYQGLLQLGEVHFSWQVTQLASVAPVIASVTLSEDDPSGKRFNSQSFTTTAVMEEDGLPPSTKGIRGWVEGTLGGQPISDEITEITPALTTVPSRYKDGRVGDAPSAVTWAATGNEYNLVLGTNGPTKDVVNWMVYFATISKVKIIVDPQSTATFTLWGSNDGSSWQVAAAYGADNKDVLQGVAESNNFYNYYLLTRYNNSSNSVTDPNVVPTLYFDPVGWTFTAASADILTFASDKDLANFAAGDYIEQENTTLSTLEPSELNPADSTSGTLSNNGLTFAGTGASYARSYVTVKPYQKVQFEMRIDTTLVGALIGYSVEGSPGTPAPSLEGAVYDSTGDFRITGTWTPSQTDGETYGQGDIVGATLDNGTGTVTFYKNGALQGSVSIQPNQSLKLYVHANTCTVTANFGANGFTYPVDGFANFETYEPSGTVGSVDTVAKTMTLATSIGTWGPANDGHYVLGPLKPVENAKLYLTLDGDLNVTDLQSDPTEAKAITGLTGNIKFPALLPSGQTPDEALPTGTTMTTEITAVNTAGADVKESNAVTPIESIGPNATMHGLRFEGARQTYLTGSKTPVATFTFSAWIKPTSTNVFRILESTNGNGYALMQFRGSSLQFEITDFSTIKTIATTGSFSLNQWHHVVYNYNGTTVEIYVNGNKAASENATLPDMSLSTFNIGRYQKGNSYDADGYLSDLYFVDGQALDATAFGAEFEGKWGPLDSSVVKTNIDAAKETAFPDDQYNTSQVWSSTATGNTLEAFGETYEKAFNGELTNWCAPAKGNDDVVGFTFDSVDCSESLRIYYFRETASNYLKINNNDVSDQLEIIPAGDAKWATITGITSLNSIQFNNAAGDGGTGSFNTGIAAIECNGRILVDGGFGPNGFFLPFDPAATDGNYSSNTTGTPDAGTWADAFDGNLSTAVIASSGDPGTTTRVTFDTPLSGTWRFYVNNGSAAANLTDNVCNVILSDGQSIDCGAITTSSTTWTNAVVANNISYIELFGKNIPQNSNGISLFAIELDGVILVDHNNIGVDDSGNGNHFHDQNFTLTGNTQDTVLDTPMNNYAVLATGTNGNLVASANGTNVTYMGDAGVDYYYEADGAGAVHTGGTAFSSESGKTYNFGQQPFADVGPQGDELTLYQTWLEWNDVATFLADNPAHVLTYQAIEAALESYEGNRDAFRAALRQRLIDDGYAPEEVEVLGL